jgi:hypothetical protein
LQYKIVSMKKNMSSIDRGVRIVIAIVIAALYATHIISGVLAIVLLAVAAVFILTGFISFCPLYAVLGMSTSDKKTNKDN